MQGIWDSRISEAMEGLFSILKALGTSFPEGGVMLCSAASLVNLASRDRDNACGWG
jgi:hypothetical protein